MRNKYLFSKNSHILFTKFNILFITIAYSFEKTLMLIKTFFAFLISMIFVFFKISIILNKRYTINNRFYNKFIIEYIFFIVFIK